MRQRSRVPWLRHGDRNTKFFHAQAAMRRRLNKIERLVRDDGSVCQTPEDDQSEVQQFYQALYTPQGFNPMDGLMDLVPTRVSDQMNAHIDMAYTAQEVKTPLFQMAPSKAPGVDGFTAGFFQRHWTILKDDIIPAVLGFLNGGELPKEIMIHPLH